MADRVIRLPTARRRRVRNPDPEPQQEWIDCEVPERHDEPVAARRGWFEDRWRAFHMIDPTSEETPLHVRLHHQLRRRRM